MRKVIGVFFSLILAATIVFVLPDFMNNSILVNTAHLNEESIISQEVKGHYNEEHEYHKLYNNGELVGVITDLDYFNDLVSKEYVQFENDFPNTTLGLVEDLYIVDETSEIEFENIDDEILNYVVENNLLGIETTAVEFSTVDGVYEICYVSSEDDFVEARDQFFRNFVSEETITKLTNQIAIDHPTTFGSIETNLKVESNGQTANMTFSKAIVAPDEILVGVDKIYNFLCYGRKEERESYTTVEGDTVQAVGYHFGDMSARQIMMLNSDILFDEDQVLAPGTVLNVTYYESPIEVVVTKERLAQEVVLPDSPLYIEDETLKKGQRIVERTESNGIKNVLYEEEWKNGVIQTGNVISSLVVEEPVQGIIRVGTMPTPDTGTGNWGWPVANPIITCHYTCYANHGGVDFQNMYNHWGEVLAIDSGVVESVGWTDIGGYYVRINHNNGYKTYYGHMRTKPYVSVGEIVDRGDVLGPIGMTGRATGPHVHLAMYYEDKLINPCTQLACNLVPWA